MGGACFSKKSVQVHPDGCSVVPSAPSKPNVSDVDPTVVEAANAAVAAEVAAAVATGRKEGDPAQWSLQGSTAASSTAPKPSALIRAAKDGNVDLVEELIAAGCSLETRGMWENTPLLAACSYGHSNCALKLIDLRADCTARNEHGATPLHYAAVEGSFEAVRALLNTSRIGTDACKQLVNCGEAKVYNRHLDAYAQRTPLGSAAESGFLSVVELLLDAGADVESVDSEGRSTLWLACRQARTAVAKGLLQRKADASMKDKQGTSVLGAAMVLCSEDLVLELLAQGVGDVNDTAGSPLREAVRGGHHRLVETLITHGAKLQPETLKGQSMPLHVACERGDEQCVALLVHARADPLLADAHGLTATDLLRRRGLPESHIASLLAQQGAAADGDAAALCCLAAEAQRATE